MLKAVSSKECGLRNRKKRFFGSANTKLSCWHLHLLPLNSLSPDAQLAQLALTWTVVHYSHKMNGSEGFKSKASALRRAVSALRRGAV